MERRVILAVVLMFATIIVVNLLFPPAPPPRPAPEAAGEAGPSADTAEPASGAGAEATLVPEALRPPVDTVAPAAAVPAETVEVRTPLLRLRFTTRGAALVSAELARYASLAEETRGQPVQLVRPDAPLIGARWIVGRDTLDLRTATFAAGARTLEVTEATGPRTLEFSYAHRTGGLTIRNRFTFFPDRYVVDVEGELRGAAASGGWWMIDLGASLPNSEADRKGNLEALSLVVNGPEGIESRTFREIEGGETIVSDGPHWWAAIRDKYFLLALIAADESFRLGGALARGAPDPLRARIAATVPVTRGGVYRYRLYAGPQDAPRLAMVGHGLQDVNPYGWGFLRPIIRPLARGIIGLLLWAKQALGTNYGWILILFGIAVRVVLFPLYQSSMRSQMRMAELQPALQEIQKRYRSDPTRLQQEMMKIYREKGMTPLTPLTSGCLPMLLPFPFLIALFFVFRDTIEFRGADFLWMPDLSRPDPFYIVPVLMGLSMFALSWLGQRAIPQTNPQMKMIMYVMPVMMTIFFLALPAGLNVYYFAMNVASIPQQLYLNRERRRHAAKRAPA